MPVTTARFHRLELPWRCLGRGPVSPARSATPPRTSSIQAPVEDTVQRHGLTDREWASLRPLLPPSPRTGRPPKDHRLVLDGLLWLAKTGAPWRDLPERFGPWRKRRCAG